VKLCFYFALLGALGGARIIEAMPARAPSAAPASANAALIARSVGLIKTGKFEDAQKLLEARLKVETKGDEKVKLQNALADVHFYRARRLETADDFKGAIAQYLKALATDQKLRRHDAALDLNNIGTDYDGLNQPQKALSYYFQALPMRRKEKDQSGEALTLSDIALAYKSLGQHEKALGYFLQTLPLQRQIKDREGEASTLNNIGLAYGNLSQPAKALDFHRQAVPLFRELKKRGAQASALNRIGLAYDSLNRSDEALGAFLEALRIRRETKNRRGEATALNNIGQTYHSVSQYQKALGYYFQALPLRREVKDREGEAITLGNIGRIYDDLNQPEKALGYYQQNLTISRQIKDRGGEAVALSNIAGIYGSLNQFQKALNVYLQDLPLLRAIKDRENEETTLSNIGVTYQTMNQPEKALGYFLQALPIARAIHDRDGEATTLSNIGGTYGDIGQYEKARFFLLQALPILRAIKDRDGEAAALNNLMEIEARKQPELAILWGKQSVNAFQAIRRDITGLDKTSRTAYLQANKHTYQLLARLLIDAGRFSEAEDVLAMVQQDEFLDFVRRDSRGIQMESRHADLRGDEKPVVAEQDAKLQSVATLSTEEFQLSGLDTPTPAQTARLAEVQSQLKDVSAQLDEFFAAMPARFKRGEGDVQADRNQLSAIQPVLRDMGGHVAVVSTFVDDKGLELLLTLPSGPTVHLSFAAKDAPIGDKAFPAWLNTRIHAFIEAILARRPVENGATELGNILSCHGALHHQLEGTGISTLLWRLNGPLRSIPLAALRDKDGFWVEKLQNVVLTAGSSDLNLSHKPVSDWKALGLGVTQQWTVGDNLFPALSGVPGELRAVVNAPADGFNGGALSGHVLEDAGFTENSFFHSLRGATPGAQAPYQVIHIASHFQLASDSLQSFLLLGDGSPLTLAALQARARTNPLFPGVELMTLSACQTAQGTDSLGALAEVNGAKSVLATLWPVADKETALLMADFYKTHAQTPDNGKAWALQQAQLALLRGGGPSAHPYFWAGFVLMGNPR